MSTVGSSRTLGDGRSNKRLPIASLAKSLRVLEALAFAQGWPSVATLIEQTGLERTTVQRILRTLHAEGYVERTGHGEYAIAPRAYVLGSMLSNGSHLASAARPILSALHQQTGETVHLGVLDGTEVLCVEHIPADKLLTFRFPVGSRLPAYASTLGRAILANVPEEEALDVLKVTERRSLTSSTLTSLQELRAELEHVRREGFAVASSEVETGVCAVAAAVLGPGGRAIAAINVVIPAVRLDRRGVRALCPPLLQAASDLSSQLGWNNGGRTHGRAAARLHD